MKSLQGRLKMILYEAAICDPDYESMMDRIKNTDYMDAKYEVLDYLSYLKNNYTLSFGHTISTSLLRDIQMMNSKTIARYVICDESEEDDNEMV